MTTLVGQTVKVPTGYGTFRKVKVLSITEDGHYYLTVDTDTGNRFQARKDVYDRMFIPRGNKDVKPLHYKGENPATIARNYKKS